MVPESENFPFGKLPNMEEAENADSYKVSGRGELHLSVLIENMRREGYEFAVSKAEVLYKADENGKKLEPMELCYIDDLVAEMLLALEKQYETMEAMYGSEFNAHDSIASLVNMVSYNGSALYADRLRK